jgi:hypothetical protein
MTFILFYFALFGKSLKIIYLWIAQDKIILDSS